MSVYDGKGNDITKQTRKEFLESIGFGEKLENPWKEKVKDRDYGIFINDIILGCWGKNSLFMDMDRFSEDRAKYFGVHEKAVGNEAHLIMCRAVEEDKILKEEAKRFFDKGKNDECEGDNEKGISCYIYEQNKEVSGRIIRKKLIDINENLQSVLKAEIELGNRETRWELFRLGKKDMRKMEKWVFKEDFSDKQGVEFLKQFDKERGKKMIKEKEKDKDKGR
jgi:hypothetical protein